MNAEDVIRMAREAGIKNDCDSIWCNADQLQRFADLVADAEREKLEGQIQTLSAMYELASKQRDALMDEQRAQVEAMRGRMQ